MTYSLRSCVASVLAVAGLTMAAPAWANTTIQQGMSCEFAFDATAEMAHGGVKPGDKLAGLLKFTLGESKQQDDTVFYRATGSIEARHAEQGMIVGDIDYIHVTRSPNVADYVSVNAREVKGNLGGEELNFAPMLVSLYADRGTMPGFDIAMTSEAWNALAKKRVFQYHSPSAHKAPLFKVGPLSGECVK